MKEFIEKLIERLEEELIPLNQEITKYFYELKDTDNPKYIYSVGRSNALTDFKYTIKQLAEEYKQCIKSSCSNCETYDKEKHYCPKWCDVIKHTTNELAEEYNNESVKGDLISRADVMEMLTNIDLSCTVIPITEAKLQLRDIPTACNDGWISVSSGNPKETGLYQVTVDDNDEPVITAMYLAEVDIWSYHAGYGNYMKVLAWRSLPQPYQPKGE